MEMLWRNFLLEDGGLWERDLTETAEKRVGIHRDRFSPFFLKHQVASQTVGR